MHCRTAGAIGTEQVLVEADPEALDRERIDETTGFKRSTGDACLLRLSARNLAVGDGRGQERAAEELFG